MTNLVEVSKWEDGVYQLETSDPVVGGPEGIDNVQPRQLANRTRYLKDQQEAHAAAANPHPQYAKTDSPAFSGTPQAPQAAQFDNTTKIASTSFVQRALGNFQGFSGYLSSQSITAAQSGSVLNFWGASASTFTLPACSAMPFGGSFLINNSGSAPLTVMRAGQDTILCGGNSNSIVLNPNDNLLLVAIPPNQWIATGGSAQLKYTSVMSGANFTTAPQFDNSTKLATTAFVQRLGLKASGFEVYTGAAMLPASVCGAVIYTGGSSAFTLTLPAASAVPGGSRIEVYSTCAAAVTFAVQGTDTIPGAGTKIATNSGDTLALQSNGIDHWEMVGGSATLPYSSVMSGANWRTAPQFDNSTKLATTAFVQRAQGNFQVRKFMTGGSLAATDSGSWIEVGGNGPITVTLPAPSTDNLVYSITNVTNNSTAVTISTASANIYNQASAAPAFVLDVGATVVLASDASNWNVIGHYTRSPIAQTAPQFDNSTRLATTAFMKQAGESFSGIQGINATASLNSGHVGAFIWAYGGGTTLTLPPVAGVPGGATITIATPLGVTIKGSGPENINNQFGAVSNTFALNAGEQAQFVSNGGAWYLSSYTTVFGTTAPQFDSSNKLATSAFVQGALGNFRNQIGLSASTTLGAQSWGVAYTLFGASSYNVTLPPLSSGVNGAAIRFSNIGSTAYTLVGAGTDMIFNGTTANTLVLNPGDTVTLVSSGVWVMFDGSMSLLTSGVMAGAGWKTQPQFDNSTKLATTQFVQRALGNFSGVVNLSPVRALTVADLGKQVNYFGTADGTVSLPPVASIPAGQGFWITNTGTALLTVAPNGSDTFAGTSGASSLPVGINDNIYIVSSGSGSTWLVYGGSAQLKYTGSFNASLGGNGYQKLPSGLIIQWGGVSVPAGATYTYNFPLAYSVACYSIVGTRGAPGSNASFNFSPISGAQFQTQNYGTGTEIASWISIGR
ncbi:gp53-like domain-containing protein [Burkholderia cepacia]|uniref:gp53-like domain-containing protein n=1 Tax=Burkholderia cepacia TaxID=292 RepID=UPI001FC835CF|nr:hypothetical protein [Burkholderia cepacia]